jgi:hypothetical protein
MDIGQGNLVSGRIPDIKKAGLSGRISGASLFMNPKNLILDLQFFILGFGNGL